MARSKGIKNKMNTPIQKEWLGKEVDMPLNVRPKTIEVIKEVFITKEVEKSQLEGFELYKALKDVGFFQGGQGQFMEDVNGIEIVYIPHASEIYQSFAQNPEGWDIVRDYLARAFLELKDKNGR